MQVRWSAILIQGPESYREERHR